MRLFLIVNPNAGNIAARSVKLFCEDCKTCLQTLAGELFSPTYEIYLSENRQSLQKTLSEVMESGKPDRVIVAGGDGTIAETLPIMLKHPEVPLAILPMGTGNLLATNLGIPFNLTEALRIALFGEVRPVDMASLDGVPFVLNASVGIDADIMHQTDIRLKKRWGTLAYFIRGIPLLHTPRKARFYIQVDDTHLSTRAIGVTVFNAGSHLPSGLILAPDVLPDDGVLDGVILKANTWLNYIRGLYQLLPSSRYQNRQILDYFTGKRIYIETHPVLKTQADGNVIGTTPVTIELLTQKLNVCVSSFEAS